jgi:hypothetical protein
VEVPHGEERVDDHIRSTRAPLPAALDRPDPGLPAVLGSWLGPPRAGAQPAERAAAGA